jgi:hypothetical protein
MKRWAVTYLLALLLPLTTCHWSTPQSYNPYRQKYDGPRLTGKLDILVSVQPRIMLSPKWAWVTAKIEGDLPECATTHLEWGDGCISEHESCGLGRVYHEGHHYHTYGSLKPLFSLRNGDKVLAMGETTLQIGAPVD